MDGGSYERNAGPGRNRFEHAFLPPNYGARRSRVPKRVRRARHLDLRVPPWSVWYFSGGLTVVEVRFPLAVVRTVSGIPGGQQPSLSTPVRWAEANGNPSALAYWLAVAGLIAFGVALAASVALYLQEGRVERALPADPATVQGGVLLAAGVAFGAATVRSVTSQPGLVVPVGAPFLLAFGAVLIAGKQSE